MPKRIQDEMVPDDAPAALIPPLHVNRRDPNWGLEPCLSEYQCVVCKAVEEMALSELKIMRNFYVEGVPVRIIAFSYDIPARQIYGHARRHGWDTRRATDRKSDKKRLYRNIAMARYIQFQHLGAPNTPDKMLELLMKSEGMVGGNKVEVETETVAGGRWEDRLMALKQKTKVRVGGGDEPIVTDADYAQYPGEKEV